jgi:hypothetical protein
MDATVELWLIGLSAGLGVLALVQALTMLPRPHWAYRRRRLAHEHEFTHNPGDGYFYCAKEPCDARRKLGR